MSLPRSFYREDEKGRFSATALCRGPWSAELQHAGPPAALIGRAIARAAGAGPEPGAAFQLARLSIELMRPIPVAGSLSVETDVVRAGRKVEVRAASLSGERGPLARATALLVRRAAPAAPAPPVVPPPVATPLEPGAGAATGRGPAEYAPPPPEACAPYEFPFFLYDVGYHRGVELRRAHGAFGSGAMGLWFRMRAPLLEGEEPSPLERVLLAADSTNGVSVALDIARYSFVNADLTVALLRPPEGEWVCLDARTIPGPTGAGLAEARLHDARGRLGTALQSLVIEER